MTWLDSRLNRAQIVGMSSFSRITAGLANLHDSAAAASYIADASKELGLLAKRHRLDTLGYLLDMAHLEASQSASPTREPGK